VEHLPTLPEEQVADVTADSVLETSQALDAPDEGAADVADKEDGADTTEGEGDDAKPSGMEQSGEHDGEEAEETVEGQTSGELATPVEGERSHFTAETEDAAKSGSRPQTPPTASAEELQADPPPEGRTSSQGTTPGAEPSAAPTETVPAAEAAAPPSRSSKPSTPDSMARASTPPTTPPPPLPVPVRDGNTIDDEHFFPQLPDMLHGVSDRLGRILQYTQMMEKKHAQASAITAAAIAAEEGLSDNEKALIKGMPHNMWSGPPLLQSITGQVVDVHLIPGIKRKKGKKKEQQVVPALERIMGYAGSDMSEEEVVSEEDPDDEAAEDGVVDRDYIKLRAMKVSARAAAQRTKA